MHRTAIRISLALAGAAALGFGLHAPKAAAGAAPPCVDADMDGNSAWPCGGDCDDSDPLRYPGNTEVCDSSGHDEDCDPYTVGRRDVDADGEIDGRCTNRLPDGQIVSGTDVDDSNPAIQSGAQVCNGGDQVYIFWGVKNGSWAGGTGVVINNCPAGTKCITQPNKTGICATPPPGYVPPPAAAPPPPPASRPALPSHQQLLSAIQNRRGPAATVAPSPLRSPLK